MTARAAAGSPHCSSKVARVRRPSSWAGSTCTAFCASLNAAVSFLCGGLYYRQNFGFKIGVVSIVVRPRRGGEPGESGATTWDLLKLAYLAQMVLT